MSRTPCDEKGCGEDLRKCCEGAAQDGSMPQLATPLPTADEPSHASRSMPLDPGPASNNVPAEAPRPEPVPYTRTRSKLKLPRTASLNSEPHALSLDFSPSSREDAITAYPFLAVPRSGPVQASCEPVSSPFQAPGATGKAPPPRRSLQHLQSFQDHRQQDHRQHDAFFLASLAGLGPAATLALASLPRSSTSRRRQLLLPYRQQSFRPTPRQPPSMNQPQPTPYCPISPATTPPPSSNTCPTNIYPQDPDGPPTPSSSLPSHTSSAASPQLRVRCAHSLPLPKLMSISASAPTSSSVSIRHLHLLAQGKTASPPSAAPLCPSLSDDTAPELMASWRKHHANPSDPPAPIERQTSTSTSAPTPRGSSLLLLPHDGPVPPPRSSLRALDRLSQCAAGGLPMQALYASRSIKERGI